MVPMWLHLLHPPRFLGGVWYYGGRDYSSLGVAVNQHGINLSIYIMHCRANIGSAWKTANNDNPKISKVGPSMIPPACSLRPAQQSNPCPMADADDADDADDASLVTCRFCLGTENEEFVAPCKCRGGQRWVHLTCRWREQVRETWNSFFVEGTGNAAMRSIYLHR